MATASFFCDAAGNQDTHAAIFNFDTEYLAEDLLYSGKEVVGEGASILTSYPGKQYVLLELDTPVFCLSDSMLIASRLDTDQHASTCRLAFTGRTLAHTNASDFRTSFLPRLKIFKHKQRTGMVDRIHDAETLIGRSLFKKETVLDAFAGLTVTLSTGEKGIIEGGFGQSGKFKIRFMSGLLPTTTAKLKKVPKAKKGKDQDLAAVC